MDQQRPPCTTQSSARLNRTEEEGLTVCGGPMQMDCGLTLGVLHQPVFCAHP